MKRLLNHLILATLFLTAQPGVAADSLHWVNVEGVAPEDQEIVKSLTGLLPGDEVDPARVQRGVDRIREYYDQRGYPQAKIQTEVTTKRDQATVLYRVELGAPVLIEALELKFRGASPTGVSLQQLIAESGFRPLEPIDQSRLKEFRRSVEAQLAGLNFIDSKVLDTQVQRSESTKRVRIVFDVELGEQVVFSVFGNQYFNRAELMSWVEEQVRLGLGRDYVAVLQNQIKERYVEQGFKDVWITPYSFEARGNSPRRVAFEIEENPRTRIRRLVFDGQDQVSSSELESIFFSVAHERIQARIYNAKMAEDAAQAMVERVRQRGYLSAKLIAMKAEEVQGTPEVDLKVFLQEGAQTIIQSVNFIGNQSITSDELRSSVSLAVGEPLSLVELEECIDRLKRVYRNLGYLDVRLANETSGELVRYSERNQFAALTFEFDEGTQLRLGSVRFFGNIATQDEVISREIQVLPGEVLSEEKIVETEGRLRRLGVFSQVKLDLTADAPDESIRNMKISVVESVPGTAGVGVGFRNDLGLRVFGEISYSNLWGLNHGWALNVSANRRMGGFLSGQNSRIFNFRFVEVEASLSYLWPWIFLGETTFRPSIVAGRRQYLNFDAETFALNLNFDRMLYRPLKVSGGFQYSLERIRQFNAVGLDDNRQLRIGSITPSLRMDLRDNPLSPRRGAYLFTSFEFADSFLGSQTDPFVAYGRYQVRTDLYADFIPRVIWYTSLRGGWLKNFSVGNTGTVPIIKQFALGGVNSLRGFLDQELNLQTEEVNGYMSFVNYRTQFDFLLTQNLTMGPFLDAGNLLLDDFSLGRLRYGTGFGMRYLTPIGPVNFDFGFKLNARPNEPTNVFYFSLGVI